MVKGHVEGFIFHRAAGKNFMKGCCSRNLVKARGDTHGVRDRVVSDEATTNQTS